MNFPEGGGILQLKKSQSTKIYLNMNFPEGGGGGILQLEKSQSTKIYLNMNFPEGGGYSATGKVTKYQDLPKYEFSGRGGYSATEKSQSTKKCLNSRGGVFCIAE